MDPERARRAHAILTAALDAPQAERDAVVTAACAGDAALEARVRRLLVAADRSTGFLESPALAEHADVRTTVPDTVGNYLVVGVLGTGGMATVYEAVQENPSRRVALKVMHQSMTSTDAFLRFRLEAETLARLHHPGIAQIYEAGTAQIGRPTASPFFAMELVPEAQTITEHARAWKLPLREKLVKFASVCDAVSHGHQNGVIHRDIKPGNILVGTDGQAKVIDFGIARTFGSAPGIGASITAQTGTASLIGTLNSMSPEQCASPESIDIRSDVYSLGVVLYELVTGRLPHDLSKCSIPEAVRIITQESAPDAGSICPQARGDLAAIITRAMEKEPASRYSSAEALASDIRRWLACEPIEARPATTFDRTWKFVRRNPTLAGALGAAVASLFIGMAVSARFAYVATQARDAALQREHELERVTEFQESLLREIDVATMGDRLRDSLSERVGAAAGSAAESGAGVSAADHARRQFADLTGGVNFTSIAVRSLNDSMLAQYRASIDAQFADQPRLAARLLQQLADTMNQLGLHADAEPVLRRALALRRSSLGEDHVDTLQSLHSLGSLLSTLGRADEAVVILKDAYARRARVLGPDHQFTLRVGTGLGGAYRRQGNLDEAHRVWSETLQAQRRVLGDDHDDTLRTLNNFGIVLAMQGRAAEAEAAWRELIDRRRRLLGEDHPEYLSTLGNLGVMLQDQGKFAEARPLMEMALAANRRTSGDGHAMTLVAMGQLASLLKESGDLPAAEVLQRECVAGLSATFGPEHPQTFRGLAMLATILHARGDRAGALHCVNQALDGQRRVVGDDHPDTKASIDIMNTITANVGSPARLKPVPPK